MDDTARSAILGKVRSQLRVRGDEPARRGAVQARLRNPVANLVPERANKPKAERIRLFQSMLEAAGTVVLRVKSWKAMPEAVAGVLRDNNLPSRLRVGDDPAFAGLKAEPGLIEVLTGPAQPDDIVSLSRAHAAASETGTLILTSGADNPSTLNFLPETHIVVVAADDVLGSFEEGWARVRQRFGQGVMPRTVNMISGPSRTADIEQTLVRGAHGPKNLFVLVVG